MKVRIILHNFLRLFLMSLISSIFLLGYGLIKGISTSYTTDGFTAFDNDSFFLNIFLNFDTYNPLSGDSSMTIIKFSLLAIGCLLGLVVAGSPRAVFTDDYINSKSGSKGVARWSTKKEAERYLQSHIQGWVQGQVVDEEKDKKYVELHDKMKDLNLKINADIKKGKSSKASERKLKRFENKHGDFLFNYDNFTLEDNGHCVVGFHEDEIVPSINVLGSSGKRKTRSNVLPSLLYIPYSYIKVHYHQNGGRGNIATNNKIDFKKVKGKYDLSEFPDIVVTDPKYENYLETSNYYRDIGYDVRCLDYIHLMYGDSLNQLEYIESEKEILETAKNLIATLRTQEGTKMNANPIWQKGASQFFAFCISYAIDVHKVENVDMEKVIEIVTMPELQGDSGLTFHEFNDMSEFSRSIYKTWLLVGGSIREGILGGLAIDLTLFTLSNVKNVTSKSTINLKNLGMPSDRPTIIYIGISADDNTFRPIVNITITTLFNQLYKNAYSTVRTTLPRKVVYLGEESFSVGPIGSLETKLSTLRSIGIISSFIWQDVNQANKLYGDDGFKFMTSNIDTTLVLGVNDDKSAEWISKRSGTETIKTKSAKRSVHSDDVDEYSTSEIAKPLLFETEIIDYPVHRSYVFQGGRKPTKLVKKLYKSWDERYKACELADVKELPKLNERELTKEEVEAITKAKEEELKAPKIEIKLEKKLEEAEKIEEKEDIKEEITEEVTQDIKVSEDIVEQQEEKIKLDIAEEELNQQPTVSWFDDMM